MADGVRADPRKHLAENSHLWVNLLTMAAGVDASSLLGRHETRTRRDGKELLA
jgi:hypothetical protein